MIEQMCDDSRCSKIDRLDNIGRSIDIWSANHLNIVLAHGGDFSNQRSHILIDVVAKDSLNQENMVPALHCLHYPEVIDITVTVKVEVGQHI